MHAVDSIDYGAQSPDHQGARGCAAISSGRPHPATPGTVATSSLPASEDAPTTDTVTVSGSPSANYSLTAVDGTLTIQTPLKVPSIDLSSTTITYGTDLTGQLGRDVLDGSPSVPSTCVYETEGSTITEATLLDAGTYVVDVECTVDNPGTTYISPVLGSFTITVSPKPVTVTAGTTQKWQGSLDPTFTVSATGFVGADTISILGDISLTRASGETPGDYAITAIGGTHPNYSVSRVAGKLYIAKITITATESDGVLTSRDLVCECEGLRPGSTTTLKIFSEETSIQTVTAADDGTCPFVDPEIPSSVPAGNHTLRVDGEYPTTVSLSTSKPVTLIESVTPGVTATGSVSSSSGVFVPPGTEEPEFIEWDDPMKVWTRKADPYRVKFYAKYPEVGAKIQFMVKEGDVYKEYAWYRHEPENVDKLKDRAYFVRTLVLEPGKNRVKILIDGEEVWKRRTYKLGTEPENPIPVEFPDTFITQMFREWSSLPREED